MPCYNLDCGHRVFVTNELPNGLLTEHCPVCGVRFTLLHRSFVDSVLSVIAVKEAHVLDEDELRELQLEDQLNTPYQFGDYPKKYTAYDPDIDCLHYGNYNYKVDDGDLNTNNFKRREIEKEADKLLVSSGYKIKKVGGNPKGCQLAVRKSFFRRERELPKEIQKRPCRGGCGKIVTSALNAGYICKECYNFNHRMTKRKKAQIAS